jgi:hypothetical protein
MREEERHSDNEIHSDTARTKIQRRKRKTSSNDANNAGTAKKQ